MPRKPKTTGSESAKQVNFKQLTEKEKEQTYSHTLKTGLALKKKLASANNELDSVKADSQLQIADLEAKLERALAKLKTAGTAAATTTDATAMDEDGKGDAGESYLLRFPPPSPSSLWSLPPLAWMHAFSPPGPCGAAACALCSSLGFVQQPVPCAALAYCIRIDPWAPPA